ncbi:hypothetical protein [Streptomyces sp. NPDC001635]
MVDRYGHTGVHDSIQAGLLTAVGNHAALDVAAAYVVHRTVTGGFTEDPLP